MKEMETLGELLRSEELKKALDNKRDPVIIDCLKQGKEAVELLHHRASQRVHDYLSPPIQVGQRAFNPNRFDDVLCELERKDDQSWMKSPYQEPRPIIGKPKRNRKAIKAKRKQKKR